MTDLAIPNPFATASQVQREGPPPKVFGNVYNGRYHMPPLVPEAWSPGYAGKHIPRGVMRMSNLVGAYVDQKALQEWQDEHALRGFIASPHLYERLTVMPIDAPRWKWVALAEEARKAADAHVASERGTARHDMLETWLTTGRQVGTGRMLLQLAEIRRAFNDHLLKPIPELTERVIICEELQAVGRFDGAVTDLQTGEVLVDDLKTKRRQFWTMLEVRAQLAGYARATAMWDAEQLCYVDPPPFSLSRGIVVHLPVDGDPDPESPTYGEPIVMLLEADLAKGWATAQRAREIVDDRSEAKSVGALRCVLKLPEMTDVERYAHLLAAVETLAEGSALMEEIDARGLWCPELFAVAQASARQIAGII